jgi:uncharacterized membrane protein
MLSAIAIDTIAPIFLQAGISLVRQAVVFVYLTFIPGIVVLRVLGVRSLNLIETALYSACLSIAMLMFLGLLVNETYPGLGITKPLAVLPLTITVTLLVLLLLTIAYLREKPSSGERPNANQNLTQVRGISHSSIFAVLLPPIVSIVGIFFVNFFRLNTILLFLFPAISVLIILVSLGKLDHRLYPLATLMIAVALLFQFSLLSPYLVGWDINHEYYLAKLVESGSVWNSAFLDTINSALSVTLVPGIYAQLMNTDIVWVFKVTYPLIFSLVPLGLYETYRKQTNAVIAFLSVFFFMSFNSFFNEMLWLGRQQLATLFVVALVLLILSRKIGGWKRNLLFLVFGASLVVSHYATTYLFMICVFIGIIFLYLMKNPFLSKILQNLKGLGPKTKTVALQCTTRGSLAQNLTAERKLLTHGGLLFLFVFAFSWYTYVSSSAALIAVANAGARVWNGFSSGLFLASARDTTLLHALGIGQGVLQHQSFRLVQYVTFLLIAIGVLEYVMKRRGTSFDEEFGAMMLACTSIFVAGVALPYFAATLDISRIYFFASLFLAPFCVLGGMTTLTFPLRNHFPRLNKQKLGLVLVTIILLAYFLLSTGFIYEVTQDVPSSVSLSMERMKTSNVPEVRAYLSGLVLTVQDVSSATWLSSNRNATLPIYADFTSSTHALQSYGSIYQTRELSNSTKVLETGYTYLNQLNVVAGIMTGSTMNTTLWKKSDISSLLEFQDKIYSNGFSEIYFNEGKGS